MAEGETSFDVHLSLLVSSNHEIQYKQNCLNDDKYLEHSHLSLLNTFANAVPPWNRVCKRNGLLDRLGRRFRFGFRLCLGLLGVVHLGDERVILPPRSASQGEHQGGNHTIDVAFARR